MCERRLGNWNEIRVSLFGPSNLEIKLGGKDQWRAVNEVSEDARGYSEATSGVNRKNAQSL